MAEQVLALDELFESAPLVHNGRTVTWGISRELAEFLGAHVSPGDVTLETGSGFSTVIILSRGVREHISIQPDPDEFEVIRTFCRQKSIDASPLTAIVSRSQDYLPSADVPGLDLVLIDGDHAFPIPFLDWYYTADRLRVGGLMIIDDINIVTGTILADFMEADARWKRIYRDREQNRFAIYEKRSHVLEVNWPLQAYLQDSYPTVRISVVRQTPKGLIERAAAHVLPWRIQAWLRVRRGWPRPTWVA